MSKWWYKNKTLWQNWQTDDRIFIFGWTIPLTIIKQQNAKRKITHYSWLKNFNTVALKKPKPTMTISNSKTWIKLNQIDCESHFNLNLGSHLLPWLFDHIITCTIPKSRINDHFYSHRKDTAEKDREHLFTSAATNLTFSHLQRLFWSLTLSFLFLEQNECLRLIQYYKPTLNEKKKSHTQHQQYNDKVAYIKHKTFINWMNKTYPRCNK